MVRLAQEHVLIVGDSERQVQAAVAAAAPAASVVCVPTVFDAIHELNANVYTSVFVNVEPIERRAEAATRALREAAGDGRIVLVSSPTHEPLSRRLIEAGMDDYLIAPPQPQEIQQILTGPTLRAGTLTQPQPSADGSAPVAAQTLTAPSALQPLLELPLADILVETLYNRPQDSLKAAVENIRARIGQHMSISVQGNDDPMPIAGADRLILSHPLRGEGNTNYGKLVVEIPQQVDQAAANHTLAQVAGLLAKTAMISERHARLQKLAITDELTGVNNSRYFKHFLKTICDRALTEKFTVSLLLFDIDNFKRYNDQFGHGVGDQILIQTAQLMKRCCRDHDLVARISGDEFAVVFWEREGPRMPKAPGTHVVSRIPQTPLTIADRFRKNLSEKCFTEFNALGPAGRGILTISGGMAVFPWDARTPEELIDAADRALMFGAKKGGKNSIYLVGAESDLPESPSE